MTFNIRSTLITLLLVAFIGFFVWALFSPKNDIEEIISNKLASEKEKSDIAFKTVTFSEIDDGIKYWELNASSSTVNNTTGITNLKVVDGLFFKEGKQALKFIAPRAAWYMNSKEIYLHEPFGYDVRYEKEFKEQLKALGGLSKFISIFSLPSDGTVSKAKGYWFKAKNLEWKLSTKKLYCDGGIILTKGDATIRSNKLEADVGLERVLLTDRPSAVLYSEKDKASIAIDAASFLVDSDTNKIFANGPVVIQSRAAKIFADNAVYDQGSDMLALQGNVSLNSGRISAWGDSADFSLSDRIAALSGNARALRDKSELQGEKIIVLTDEGKLFIEGRSKATINESELDRLNK